MISKVLVANRAEIAIRAFRAAYELGIATVAVYPYEDRNSPHRLADEAYQIGEVSHPERAYLSVDQIVATARQCRQRYGRTTGRNHQPAGAQLDRGCRRATPYDTGLSLAAVSDLEPYWEALRKVNAPFESDIPAPTGRVYHHKIPGGQLSNLRQRAIALGSAIVSRRSRPITLPPTECCVGS
jgi:pyruvate carboxylase